MGIEQNVLMIFIILLCIIIPSYYYYYYCGGGFIENLLIKNASGDKYYQRPVPAVPRTEDWKDESQVYFQGFFKWIDQQRKHSASNRISNSAPNGTNWMPPKRYPHGVLDSTLQFDLNVLAKRYWDQATRESGVNPGSGIEQGTIWTPYVHSFDWLDVESAWISDTMPISNWKLIGMEGFVQDRIHYVNYRVWLVTIVKVGQPLTCEPATNIPGTYYIGYPTPGQVSHKIGFPLPTDVIVSGGDILRTLKPENPEFLEVRLWGLWILDSTLALATHPIYTKSGNPPSIQFPWPSPGWADSSLESSTPVRKILEDSTPWCEPAVIANQWILPSGMPNNVQPFPCGQIPSWNWDDWGINPRVAPKELSCPWQTYALRSLPLCPNNNPTNAQLPRDIGKYTWMFDPPSGVSQLPHATSN